MESLSVVTTYKTKQRSVLFAEQQVLARRADMGVEDLQLIEKESSSSKLMCLIIRDPVMEPYTRG